MISELIARALGGKPLTPNELNVVQQELRRIELLTRANSEKITGGKVKQAEFADDAHTVDGEHAAAFADAVHTHGGGDIISAVANATRANNLDGYYADIGPWGNTICQRDGSGYIDAQFFHDYAGDPGVLPDFIYGGNGNINNGAAYHYRYPPARIPGAYIPITSNAYWNGSAQGIQQTLITVTSYGIPSGVKAVIVRNIAYWTSANNNYYQIVKSTADGSNACAVFSMDANIRQEVVGIVPVNSNQVRVDVTGAGTAASWVIFLGYFR